jgi:hypothetical protein
MWNTSLNGAGTLCVADAYAIPDPWLKSIPD